MLENYTYLADLQEQIGEIPPDSIVSRTLFSNDQVKVVLFGFAVVQELSEHTASMPAQLPHSLVAEPPLTMILLLIK